MEIEVNVPSYAVGGKVGGNRGGKKLSQWVGTEGKWR